MRAQLYPLHLSKVSEPDVDNWMRETVERGLVRRYTIEGRPYLEVLKFGQRLRAKRAKFPRPPDLNGPTRGQVLQTCFSVYTDSVSDSVPDSDSSLGTRRTTVEGSKRAHDIYACYPRKVGKPDAIREIDRAIAKFPDLDIRAQTVAFAGRWEGHSLQYCPYPSTWFHQERFNDNPDTWGPHGGPQQPERGKIGANEIKQTLKAKRL